MYYTIYKTYNLINGKEYIGKHQTRNINDEYMGSGKLVKRAIIKYGEYNFIKDILYVFKTELEMNIKESELVSEEYINSKLSYNLCPGGNGGFGYINENRLADTKKGRKNADKVIKEKYGVDNISQLSENKIKSSNTMKLMHKLGIVKSFNWTGRNHKEESKIKIGKSNSKYVGNKNSQYGTCWITNGEENKKIKKEELDFYLNQGYCKGRNTKIALLLIKDNI